FSLRHALRPEAFPGPGDLRPTLCGTRARPINKPFRGPTRTPICLTCARIERAYPPQRAHDASFDSAVLVTMVGKLRHRAHDDDIAPLLDYCFPCPDTTRLQLPRHTLAATGTTGPTGLAIDP
ncbi:MAG: hypothetical protein OEY23_18940, partial [Acidimicrobiia bacterium]|nr:hypothetical protein [Acidimicrobiia bacterium]